MHVLLSFSLRALLALAVAPPAPVQPDVVLIVADDLGFADVGWNGSEIATPHLDRLAGEGVVLDRFYVTPLCSPSRAALLTGRYPVHAGISEPVTHTDTTGLGPDVATLADDLRAGGYATAMVGKWHLGKSCHHHPLRHGFDSFVGLVGGGANYFTQENALGPDWWRGFELDDPDGYTTDLIADEAVATLTRSRAGPLFLYLPFTAPHTPLNALDEDLARYPDLPEPRRTYAAMVTALDRAVGQVMAAVEASGRPTVVWFLSDNGGLGRVGGSNAPLRGQKGQVYEGGIRVPSAVWYPAWGSRTVEAPIWALDVVPTVLGLAGLAPSRPLDGADVGPVLAGGAVSDALLDRVLFSYRRNEPGAWWLSAQSARWKYVERAVDGVARSELFRIDRDPLETSDRLRSNYPIAGELRAAARAYAARTPEGASHDVTLDEPVVPDLCCCGVSAPPPPPPGADGRWVTVLASPSPRPALEVGGLPTDRARVDLFDALGRRVRTLHDGPLATAQRIEIGDGLAPGTYTVRVTEAAGTTTASITVVR